MYVKKFTEITKNDVSLVGGKGASLGEMTNAGIPVPSGFVVTTDVFRIYSDKEIPQNVQEEILKAFDDLGAERVAVRSSAVAEDSSTASWAGQLESYLNTTRENLIENIKKCWNSIKTQGALAYASEQNLPEEKLAVAVVVQKMVDSEASGVIFTVNPISKNKDEAMIDTCPGLGELLVQGMVNPDDFVVDKNTLEIKERKISMQEMMMVYQDGETKEVPVTEEKKSEPVLNDEQIKELVVLAKRIEEHYQFPQDIEFGIERGKIFILQSRPITTL